MTVWKVRGSHLSGEAVTERAKDIMKQDHEVMNKSVEFETIIATLEPTGRDIWKSAVRQIIGNVDYKESYDKWCFCVWAVERLGDTNPPCDFQE